MWVTCIVGLILGLIAGYFIKTNIWVAVTLVGGVAGFFLGFFIHGIIVATTPHEENWEMILICVILAIIGALLAVKWGREIVVISTSFIGSYLIMRGLSFCFGGYPDENKVWADISEGKEITVETKFWYCLLYTSPSPRDRG